jgi:hypothetical protein
VLHGHAQAMQALNERPVSQAIRHVITNTFLAEESENDARLIAYMTAYKYDDGTPTTTRPLTIDGPFRLLLVKNHFVRENGRWMIAESESTTEFEFRKRA